MTLAPGTKLGPYEILAPIGAGGMGEVYRARDTKLDREVAIKILPAALAQDPERLARFEREAKVLASLNHPNIAQIYGVEDRALVMELVPGESLKGPLQLETALNYAKQIVDAIEAAHEKGIVHRDLKPANIMITPSGVVKVLDFGLAAVGQASTPGDGNPTNSPTLTMRATQAGMIMGTAGYMSPEQAAGQPVDRRADIWAFGVVLCEMLTGERLFTGDSIAHILADVLRAPIDFDRLMVPTPIKNLLRRCLDRDVKNRLQAIGEARIAIQNYLANPTSVADVTQSTASRSRLGRAGWGVAAALAIGLVWVASITYRPTRPAELKPLMRLSVDLGPEAVAGVRATVAISADGTRIVFPVRVDGRQLLGTRLLDQPAVTPLAGTEDGEIPFFSPDGQWVAFFAGRKLKKISVTGGATVTLCDAPRGLGGSWGEDGNIIAALNLTGALSRVPASGGVPQPLTKPANGTTYSQRWPQILPGGKAVIFMSSPATTDLEDANIEVESLQSSDRKVLWRGGYFGRYLPTNGSAGHLIYVHQGTLFSVPFDAARLEVRGTPAPILENIAANPVAAGGQFDFSATGTFVYLNGQSPNATYPVVWMESSGKTQPLITKSDVYLTPRVSPDGRRVAVAALQGTGRNIWVYDTQRDSMTRLTFGVESQSPVWSPDGKHIVFRTASDSGFSLNWIRADGAAEALKLLESKNDIRAHSFSPDGRRLAYYEFTAQGNNDLWTLPLDVSDPEHPKPGKSEPFLRTPFNETMPVFSPDGRWIAYYSDESGTNEVYVRPFPGPGGKWQISTGGGRYPVWSRNGRELFYETRDNQIMVTEYTAKGGSFAASKPRSWSDKRIYNPGGVHADLAPDGKRFAVFPRAETTGEDKGSLHVTFLLNFFDELRRRAPMGK